MDLNQPSPDQEIDFSHYLDKQPGVGTVPQASAQSTRRFLIKQIVAAGIIIVLAGVLFWLLFAGGNGSAKLIIPPGYRLSAPGGGPPRLEKIK